MTERLRLGELLVETGLITREQLEEALSIQKERGGRRLGEILVDQGVVTESEVTQVLSQQLSVPWVSLQHIDFSRQLLNLVSAEAAEKLGIVPIYVRRARNRKQTLYVAMLDPTDTSPLEEIAEHAGLPVRPMIAPASDIRAAVRAYYLDLPPEEEADPSELGSTQPGYRSMSPSTGPPGSIEPADDQAPSVPPIPRASSVPQVSSRSEGRTGPSGQVPTPPSKRASTPAGARAETDAQASFGQAPEPPGVARELEKNDEKSEDGAAESEPLAPRSEQMAQPSAEASDAPKMVTLTMLDGTQITLPAAPTQKRDGRPSIGPSNELTARDLIEALRAQAEGADASEVLGHGVKWESLFAALLSLLLKKHLIHDWEFVRELRR